MKPPPGGPLPQLLAPLCRCRRAGTRALISAVAAPPAAFANFIEG